MSLMIRIFTKTGWFWLFGALGDSLLITGLVMAALNHTVAGFTPMLWITLALISYVWLIFVTLVKILARLEKQV